MHRKSKHAIYIQYIVFENHVVYEIVWKIMVQPDRAQMKYNAMQKMCALHAG